FEKLAAVEAYSLRCVLGRDVVEPDRHNHAERRVAQVEVVRRRERLRLLQEEERHPAELTGDGGNGATCPPSGPAAKSAPCDSKLTMNRAGWVLPGTRK